MPRTLSLLDTDPDIIDRAMCPRCHGDVRPVERIRDNDDNVIGYRVRHADSDAACSRREWPIYDPDWTDEDPTPAGDLDGEGLSVCMTCLSYTQHIEKVGEDERNAAIFEVVEPKRDEAGQVICPTCARRTGPRK